MAEEKMKRYQINIACPSKQAKEKLARRLRIYGAYNDMTNYEIIVKALDVLENKRGEV